MDAGSKSNLILLQSAVRVVYAAVYHGRYPEAPTHERLGSIAQLMVALVPLYKCEGGEGLVRRLDGHELAGAIVRRAGKELCFSDGRAPLSELYVSRTGIDHVIHMLQADIDQPQPARDLHAPQPYCES